jgi:glycosyltransferase involved in cell wall biosynthesis
VQLPQAATLAVLGRGEAAERIRLENLASALEVSDRVRFGALERADLADAYRAHDCVVFPSEWPEPFGMVPLEAMACGTPVVSTAMGGLAEYLVDGANSVIIEPRDEGSLANGIAELAADRTMQATIRQGGLATAARFDVRLTTDAYERWHVAAANGSLVTENPPATGRPGRDRLLARQSQRWRGWHR